MAQTDEPENGGTKDPEQINDGSCSYLQCFRKGPVTLYHCNIVFLTE